MDVDDYNDGKSVIQLAAARPKKAEQNGHQFDDAPIKVPHEKPPRFLFETISDLRSMPPAEYLVDRWIPKRGVGLLYGKWGSFKTFIAFDVALHLAYGLANWHGARLPGKPCDVLIIAREGHSGFVKRVEAFKRHHGLKDDPVRLVFMRSTISFLDDAGFEELKVAIASLARPFGCVLVDTVGRVLPGADMAKEQPITLFMERLQQLGEITGGVSIGVHHENKSGDANGSMYFQNNSDFMFSASRDGDKLAGTLTCEKQKEDDDLWSKSFALAKIDLGRSASSLVVESISDAEPKRVGKGEIPRPLAPGTQLALDCINEAIINAPIVHSVGGSGPSVRAADLKCAREEHKRRYVYEGDGDEKEKAAAQRQAWSTGKNALLGKKRIAQAPTGDRNLVWIVKEEARK
jgi:AAA domain